MTSVKLFSWKRGRTAATRMYIDVYAEPQPDGTLRLSRTDMGPDLEERYGDYDLESWFFISAADMPSAMTAILAYSFSQRKRLDWHSLIDCLKAAGVKVSVDIWT